MALLVLPPTVEPLTVEDVRLRLKYPRADQDVAIADWIAAARNAVERYTERGLMTQTWELKTRRTVSGGASSAMALASAPLEATESHREYFARNLTTIRTGGAIGARAFDGSAEAFGYIDLPWAAPLQAIESVADDIGTIPPEAYAVDNTVEPARLYWLDGAQPAGVITIRYRLGYGDAPEAVPPNLRQVVMALVQQYFLYRAGPPPASALEDTLCHADGYRVRTFA
jgi:hypothetical protein